MRDIIIDRPHSEPRIFRVKGALTVSTEGLVCLTCKERGGKATFWISFPPEVIKELNDALATPESRTERSSAADAGGAGA